MAERSAPSCVVIFNPIKVSADFRDRLAAEVEKAGWPEATWLETTEEDLGRGMARRAVELEADRVIAAGGDGTIRAVADGLAGSSVVLGIVPSGTGNLLARNLGIPLAEASAITMALDDQLRKIDLIKITIDGGRSQHFAVMAGVGVDAMIMDETSPALKSAIGPAAYFVAAGKALGRVPLRVVVTIDGGRPHRRRTLITLIGNVSQLTANITLIPGAEPDDGQLDIFIASPRRITHWFRVIRRLISRRRDHRDPIDQWQGRHVEIQLANPESLQLDGDVVGPCTRLVADVVPGALIVCAPPGNATGPASGPGR